MLPGSSLIQCDRPAADRLRARIAAAAQRLGVADPLAGLADLFTRTFSRPARDPEYRSNRLQPGALPIEWSFSEADPGALRIEFQPFETDLSPPERLLGAAAAMLPVVRAYHGENAAAQFAAAAPRVEDLSGVDLQFGAFLALSAHRNRRPNLKIYFELNPSLWPEGCEAVSCIAGATPHFRSVSAEDGGISERHYFLCRDGLRLLELQTLCAGLGMRHRSAPLLLAILELTEGEFYLPPQSVVLDVRHSPDPEVKVELISGLAMLSQGLQGRIAGLLQPQHTAAFERWAGIVHPHAPHCLEPSVVSVRVSPRKPVNLSVYAAEPESQW